MGLKEDFEVCRQQANRRIMEYEVMKLQLDQKIEWIKAVQRIGDAEEAIILKKVKE